MCPLRNKLLIQITYGFQWSVRHFPFGYSKTEYDKKELKFANLNFTMQVRHVFQVFRGVISRFYVLFPGSMLNHRPVFTSLPPPPPPTSNSLLTVPRRKFCVVVLWKILKSLNSTVLSKKGASVYWIYDPCWCNMVQISKGCHDEMNIISLQEVIKRLLLV